MKARLTRCLVAWCVCLTLWGLGSTAYGGFVLLGSDYLETLPGTYFDFGGPIGPVALKGLPVDPLHLGTTDTIIQRMSDATLFPGTVPIEMVQLSLVSVSPVTISGTSYDVFVHLTPSLASVGTMTIRHELPDNGSPAPEGTFDSFFDVFFTADFTEVGNPFGTFAVPGHATMQTLGAPWSHEPIPGALLVTGPVGNQDANDHTDRPPTFSDLHFPQQITHFKLFGGPGEHIVQAAHGGQTHVGVPEPSMWIVGLCLSMFALVGRKAFRGR